MSLSEIALASSGMLAAFFGLRMLFERSLYAAAIWLLGALLQVAVFFFFAGAPILAFLQIVIYAGAVMVLVVITIMAAPGAAGLRMGPLRLPKFLAAAALLLPLVQMALFLSASGMGRGSLGGELGAQALLGKLLFGRYAAATELVTILLFLASLSIVDFGAKELESGNR